MSNETTARNFQTLSNGLKDQRSVNSRQDKELSEMREKITILEKQLTELRSQLMGMIGTVGPTSR